MRWILLQKIKTLLREGDQLQKTKPSPIESDSFKALKKESVYSRKNPFPAEVLKNINLNGRGAVKETRHLELSLKGSGLDYKPGDVIGIYPENDPVLVDMILKEAKWDPEEMIILSNERQTVSIREALLTYYDLRPITKSIMKKAAALTSNMKLQQFVSRENDSKSKEYIKGRDLLDLIHDFGPFNLDDFVSILRRMPPRLYSIASSLAANPDEVHLTIGAVRYEAHDRLRKGVCSTMCAERIMPGDKLLVFVQENKHFGLPEDPNTPIIMVGPGTGIAPFRSFLQEREIVGAVGKSWLFFGDQHFATDFLYQTEWEKYIKNGTLSRMDIAFSRDTKDKIYVQDRMLEQSKQLFEWLQDGAFFYICGDKDRMAKDVHETIITIIGKEGSMSREKAEEYLNDMKNRKRYQLDVY